MDSFAMTVLTLPIFLPILRSLGFDFVWFGVIFVIMIEIAGITPPVGMNTFVVAGMVLSDMSQGGVPTGVISAWTSGDLPDGWLVCDGSEISRGEYSALFDVIGVHYGSGNGVSTFNVPDLRGRSIVGLDNMGGSAANVIQSGWARSLGGVYGEESHVLTINEMPAHTHGYLESPVGGRYDGHSSPVVTGQRWSQTQPAGENNAHNNIQPSIALNWIIKT